MLHFIFNKEGSSKEKKSVWYTTMIFKRDLNW